MARRIVKNPTVKEILIKQASKRWLQIAGGGLVAVAIELIDADEVGKGSSLTERGIGPIPIFDPNNPSEVPSPEEMNEILRRAGENFLKSQRLEEIRASLRTNANRVREIMKALERGENVSEEDLDFYHWMLNNHPDVVHAIDLDRIDLAMKIGEQLMSDLYQELGELEKLLRQNGEELLDAIANKTRIKQAGGTEEELREAQRKINRVQGDRRRIQQEINDTKNEIEGHDDATDY